MLMSVVLVPELLHCSCQWSHICACSGFSLSLGMSNRQMVVLEEICVILVMSSWRQNLRGKSSYSMKKYVRTVYVSSESNKDSEHPSLGHLQERNSALFLLRSVNYLGCGRYVLGTAPSCQCSGMWVWSFVSKVSMLQFLGNEQLGEQGEPSQPAAALSLSWISCRALRSAQLPLGFWLKFQVWSRVCKALTVSWPG